MIDNKIWDPLRRKYVANTPEEEVRQWFINVLKNVVGVPIMLMNSEVCLQFGVNVVKKDFRADILVYDKKLRPLIVVECKRPQVPITEEVINQALRYNMVFACPYIVVTNGNSTYICHKRENKYIFVDKLPNYNQILKEED